MAQFALRRSHIVAAAAMTALVASCAHSQGQTAPPPIAAPAPETGPISYAPSGHAGMDAWRVAFSEKALAAGHDRDIVKSVLSGISPLELWLGSRFQPSSTGIEDQAEFAKPIWDYLRVPMSDSRIRTGASRLAENPALFDALEAAYGVDREAIVAIWGMETSFGAVKGNYDAPNVLANMAVEGRRQGLAERELLSLIKILEQGDAERDDLLAGWAGAMGHTQFMPSTYLAYAQDFDGDGKKDIWDSEADALASTANYLANSGYTLHQPWGIEVLARTGFDYSLADGNERRIETWASAGLVPARGGTFETGGANYAELWLPAGAEGPKYLLFNNFKAFKAYNNADSYAFAVGLSGDAMGGQHGPIASWPTHLTPLTVSEIKVLQAALNAQGFDAGVVDGIPGRKTKGALQAFQKTKGLVADGYPTKQALALLTGESTAGVASSPGTN
ncbi:MAG: lytic murein transglycosylase [Hyphomonas sp.]|nr:lytic murein transglycosylase [Hyphomonas sp.]